MATTAKRRPPQVTLDEPAAPPALAPAPDNGVPYATQQGSTGKGRRGRQLGQRIPEELYQRLLAASQATDIPMQRLIIRGLEAELRKHGY